jgi:hypothetical protein
VSACRCFIHSVPSVFHCSRFCARGSHALLWLHMDYIQKLILRVYNKIFQLWNNQCIQYKLECSDSIQKHILRVYIIKYSNLGTMNASSIRWSVAASKLEHGRMHCNLLDTLARSNLASTIWCPSWGKSPWLATTTTPHSSLPCHCQPLALLLPLHPVPLSCMQLLSCCQACHSLPSISSPAPHPHCISCLRKITMQTMAACS